MYFVNMRSPVRIAAISEVVIVASSSLPGGYSMVIIDSSLAGSPTVLCFPCRSSNRGCSHPESELARFMSHDRIPSSVVTYQREERTANARGRIQTAAWLNPNLRSRPYSCVREMPRVRAALETLPFMSHDAFDRQKLQGGTLALGQAKERCRL